MKVTLTRYDYQAKEPMVVAVTDTRTIAKSLDHETMAELLSDYVNSGCKGTKSGMRVGEAFTHQHRTLQRLIVCWIIGILRSLGTQVYTDPRNETAIATARMIGELCDDGTLPLGRFL